MLNSYYKDSIDNFLITSTDTIFGKISQAHQLTSTTNQNKAWALQIEILKNVLIGLKGTLFFEFVVPRMGKRIDTILIVENVVFVIEFKVGESSFLNVHTEQVWDYALDLKNFHKPSHNIVIVPVLVATEAKESFVDIITTSHNDNLFYPIKTNKKDLKVVLEKTLIFLKGQEFVNADMFEKGSYLPTPTIIEAAISLYNNHSVENITRNDAQAINLTRTTDAITQIIEYSKRQSKKSICFVTGVPGAGKTLVGLKVATTHLELDKGDASVYLSGNAPLVAVLQEALTRDKVNREKTIGNPITKRAARQAVKSFIQIIHHYRDAYLTNVEAPYDHVAIFDEAQRAWNKEQTVKFMRQKKNQQDFDYSEPEFLISCLDRHQDWAVIVCLVGGGQEINTGEAGISGWIEALYNKYPNWNVFVSPNLTDKEYAATEAIETLHLKSEVNFNNDLHLSVSLRSFRAEKLSQFIKSLLDLDIKKSKELFRTIFDKYSIILTRDLIKAKAWLKEKARGSERYGLIVSSQAQRLKPFAIDVKSPMDPVNWFLNERDDIRSSYFLEDVATEYQVQGLELDWTCVTWDGDLRYSETGWQTFSFKGNKWQNINNTERKKYLINAYRVLLTRARQGMIIVVPEGSEEDPTRNASFYDPTFNYLVSLGIPVL